MPSKKVLSLASKQLDADYAACVEQFCIDVENTEPFKMFCLGVMMCMMTLRDLAEKPEHLFGDADMEVSAEAYFESARVRIHAD